MAKRWSGIPMTESEREFIEIMDSQPFLDCDQVVMEDGSILDCSYTPEELDEIIAHFDQLEQKQDEN
jgi:hypothetical protein